MKFTEEKLEKAFTELMGKKDFPTTSLNLLKLVFCYKHRQKKKATPRPVWLFAENPIFVDAYCV